MLEDEGNDVGEAGVGGGEHEEEDSEYNGLLECIFL